MNECRKPAEYTGISLLITAMSLTLVAPALAAPSVVKAGLPASKHVAAGTQSPKPRQVSRLPAAPAALPGNTVASIPAPVTATNRSSAEPVVIASTQPSATFAMALPVAGSLASPTPGVAAAGAPVITPAAPTAPKVNPYLAGWYRPIPAAALPAMAIGQLNYNARYISDSVASIPGRLADALPSIKTVHPTGGRDLVVANLKCPAEMMTGQYMLPANAMREGVNGLFNKLNETQLLKFDIQLVCS